MAHVETGCTAPRVTTLGDVVEPFWEGSADFIDQWIKESEARKPLLQACVVQESDKPSERWCCGGCTTNQT